MNIDKALDGLREEAKELIEAIDKVEAGEEEVEYILYKAWHIEERRRQLKFLIEMEKKEAVRE